MSIEAYRILHLIGLILVFLGLGGLVLKPGGKDTPPHALAFMLHGLGMLVMLVSGFGLLATKFVWPWGGWVFAKFGIWLLLGAMPTLIKRGAIPFGLAWILTAGVGALTVWLVVAKPF